MDIWKWVASDLGRIYDVEPELAMRLYEYPSRVTNGHHAYVDASYPELLAAVRGLGHVWLEVYVRHWWLQSKVARRHDVAEALPEAVALLDRVHEADAAECPQAVCAVQDFCIAYGLADGPGFVEERLAACHETLDRIDPSWPCWRCLSEEVADALCDGGRPAESLEFLERQRLAAAKAGGDASPWNRTREHFDLGHFEVALKEAEERDVSASGDYGRFGRRIDQARCLVRLGRVEEAVKALPRWDEVGDMAGLFRRYSDALTHLVRAGGLGWDANVVAFLAHMSGVLRRHGCWSNLVLVLTDWCRLAMEDEVPRWALADLLVRRARDAQSHLRDPGRVEDELGPLEERIAAARPEPWEGTLDEISERLEREIEDEKAHVFSRAAVTARLRPELAPIVNLVASKWRELGFTEEALEAFVLARREAPADPDLVAGHAAALIDERDWQGLGEMLDALPEVPELAVHVLWFRSVLCEERGDIAGTIDLLREMLSTGGEACGEGVTARLATLLERQGDHAAALGAWDETLARGGEEGIPWNWQRIVCATRLGRWDAVRESAIRLGIEVEPGDQEIDEDWGLFQVVDEDAEEPLWAVRTGPVTARIVTITGPFAPERYGERVIFDPQVTNPESEEAPPTALVLETRDESTAVCCPWDGPRPDDERLEAFFDDVRALGGAAYVGSVDEYVQVDPETSEEVPAVWIKVAVPAGEDGVRPLLPLFEQLAKDVGRGMALWPELLERLGDSSGAEKHRELQAAWRMN